MTTTQQTALQLAARRLVEAQEDLSEAYRAAGNSMATATVTPRLHTLGITLNALGTALEAAGATAPTEGYQGTPPPSPDSLEALRKIEGSRAEGKALLVFLRQALREAERLDRARGNWVGDMAQTDQGETPGTDYAEAIQGLLLRLQGELGAEGAGRE